MAIIIHQIIAAAGRLAEDVPQPSNRGIVRDLIDRIAIGIDSVVIHISRSALLTRLGAGTHDSDSDDPGSFTLKLPVQLKRRGSEFKIVLADQEAPSHPDRILIANLARGFAWVEELRTGASTSFEGIASREGLTANHIRLYCHFAFLPTSLIEAIVEGRQPPAITSETFKRTYPLPVRWSDQERTLEIDLPPTVLRNGHVQSGHGA